MSPYNLQNLPRTIPVFPLDGVLLLPKGQLPLNIFEPRYLAMIEDSLKTHRLIGMIQPSLHTSHLPLPPQDSTGPNLYKIGCVGKITQFQELEDGRYLITLTGLCRFAVARELPLHRGYRQIEADWADFASDLDPIKNLTWDRKKLILLLKDFFTDHGLSMDWDVVAEVADERLLTCLAMICPWGSAEKQALLEASCPQSRADLMMSLLEISAKEIDTGTTTAH